MTSVIIPKRSINDLMDEDLYTIPNSPVKSTSFPMNQSSSLSMNQSHLDLSAAIQQTSSAAAATKERSNSPDYQSLFNFNQNSQLNHHLEVQHGYPSNQHQKVFNDYSNPDQSFIQPNKLLKFTQLKRLNQLSQQKIQERNHFKGQQQQPSQQKVQQPLGQHHPQPQQQHQQASQGFKSPLSQASVDKQLDTHSKIHHNHKVNPQLIPPKRKIKTLSTPNEKFDDYLFNPNIEPSSSINFNFHNDSSVFIHPNGSNQAFNDVAGHIEEKDQFMSGLEDYNEFEFDDDLSDCDSDSDEENEDEEDYRNSNYFNDINDTDFKQVNSTPLTSNENSPNDMIDISNNHNDAQGLASKNVDCNINDMNYDDGNYNNGGFIDDFGIKNASDYDDFDDYSVDMRQVNELDGLHDNTALDLATTTIDTSNIKRFNDDLDLDMDMGMDMDVDMDMDLDVEPDMNQMNGTGNMRAINNMDSLNVMNDNDNNDNHIRPASVEVDSDSESDNSEPITPPAHSPKTTEVGKKDDSSLHNNQLQGHKLEDHHCNLTNPNTGLPCNKQFSRPYDLIRHQETIHASKKKIFRCVICEGRENGGEGNGKSKTFSRGDALSRHIKVKHQLVGKEALDLINKAKENVEFVSVNSVN